jgi:hypothetical protein
MTIAKVYGLKENPFEPTGAAVGKYPFVPPANFPMLEQKIAEAGIERKLYALLVNSPHGAGKSTTMEYLKTKATNGGYLSFRAPVILTKLSNLNLQNFVGDILQEASNYTKVESLARLKDEQRPSVLRKALVGALSQIAAKNKLMLWIVDEFDILADRPKEEQQMFLQFLRAVIDDLATHDAPIAFIMSHTKYSSREFETHLSHQHEPFRSRLVASLPLAYSFDEVKRIVALRLKMASESARQEGDLSPFSEEALKSLYDMILSIRGTESLDNFRVFERVCHFALIEGAKRGLPKVDTVLIQELFKEYGLKELPIRESRRISIKTAQEIAALKLKSLMERNEAILQGILKGIAKSTLFGGVGLKKVQTSYLGQVGDGNVGISSLSFDLLLRDTSITILWILATSKAEIIQEKDIEDVLQVVTPLLNDYEKYSHLILLSYVSSVEIHKTPSSSFERITWFPSGLAEDLIGLSVGTDEDCNVLVKSFETEIAPLLSQLVTREARDITKPLSPPTFEAIQTIFVMSANGQSCTKEAIRQINKRLFMRRSALQERYLSEAVQSGFANEEAGQIEPSVPKAHIFLLDLLEKGPQEYRGLVEKLGSAGEAIVGSASEFHLIYSDEDKIVKRRLADYENVVLPTVKLLQRAYENETVKQSEPGKWIEWLLSAYESCKKSGRAYHTHVVLSAIEKLGPQIQEEVKKSLAGPSREPIVEVVTPTPPSQVSQPIQKEMPPVSVGPQPTLTLTRTVDDAILQAIQTQGAMSIQEIEQQMRSQGYEADIRSTVFRLILQGKLKVVSAE